MPLKYINLLLSEGYFTNTLSFHFDFCIYNYIIDFTYLSNLRTLSLSSCYRNDVDEWDTILFQNGGFHSINTLEIERGFTFFESLVKSSQGRRLLELSERSRFGDYHSRR